MAVSIDTTFDMRASNCIIFLVLLIAVRAFPQNAIEFVNEAPTIVEEINVVGGNEPSTNEKVNNATTIIANEAVPAGVPEGVTSDQVVIPTEPRSASEVVIPAASEVVTTVEASAGVANEAVIPIEARSATEKVISLVPEVGSVVVASEAVIPVEAGSASEAVIPLVPEVASEVVASEAVIPVEARSASEVVIPLVTEVASEVEARSVNEAEAVISVVPEATNQAVPVQSTNEGVAGEVVISIVPEAVITQNTDTDVNEIQAPKQEVTTFEAAIVEVPQAVVNEVVVSPSEEVQSKAIPAPSEVPSEIPVDLDQVFSLRSIVPSTTTAAPVTSQDQQSVSEAINSDSPLSAPEVPITPVSTPVPETTSVASATEASEGQVSNIQEIIFGDEPVVASRSNPDFESAASTNEILGRSVLTDFPDIEVIIPLVDVSVPVISGRSLNFEPVSAVVPASDISPSSDSAPSTAQVPEVGSVVVAAVTESEMPSADVVVADSTSGSQDVESAAPVSASDVAIPTETSDSGSNTTSSAIDLVSTSTEGSVPTGSVSEAESVASTNEATVEVTSTSNEEAARSLNAESTTSTAEVVVANAESATPTESVSSTTAGPVSTDLTPQANVTAPAEAPRSTDPVVIATDSVSSTTSAPEVAANPSTSESSVPSEPEVVTSSTDASVVVDATPSTSTESPVSSSTSSIPCTKVGNFSVPTNCRLYRTCSTDGTDLTLQEHECPVGYAFSSVIRRCSRDISPCSDVGPACTRSGSIADPNTSSAYYWCASSLLGGFHKYHVQCDSNEVFASSISRCLPEALHISHKGASDARSDRDIVKAEWKILKKEIKLQAKVDKVRHKLEAKAKAYAEKLATKNVKKQKGDTKKHDDSDEEDDDEDED